MLEFLLAHRAEALALEAARELRRRALLFDAGTIAARAAGVLAAQLEPTSELEGAIRAAVQETVERSLEEARGGQDANHPTLGDPAYVSGRANARIVGRAFNALPDAERQALFRTAVLGESALAASAALGASVSEVLSRTERAVLRIDSELERTPSQPEGDHAA